MRTQFVFAAFCVIGLPAFCGTAYRPADIRAFAANAHACEHLGGEYDAELPSDQKREIERNVRTYCGAASRQLRALRAKYRNDPAMLEEVGRHANDSVTDYRP